MTVVVMVTTERKAAVGHGRDIGAVIWAKLKSYSELKKKIREQYSSLEKATHIGYANLIQNILKCSKKAEPMFIREYSNW